MIADYPGIANSCPLKAPSNGIIVNCCWIHITQQSVSCCSLVNSFNYQPCCRDFNNLWQLVARQKHSFWIHVGPLLNVCYPGQIFPQSSNNLLHFVSSCSPLWHLEVEISWWRHQMETFWGRLSVADGFSSQRASNAGFDRRYKDYVYGRC